MEFYLYSPIYHQSTHRDNIINFYSFFTKSQICKNYSHLSQGYFDHWKFHTDCFVVWCKFANVSEEPPTHRVDRFFQTTQHIPEIVFFLVTAWELQIPLSSLLCLAKDRNECEMTDAKRKVEWKTQACIPGKTRDFSLLKDVETSSGAHPTSYSMDIGVLCPAVWSWPLTSVSCWG
jgi:hypothetical protein